MRKFSAGPGRNSSPTLGARSVPRQPTTWDGAPIAKEPPYGATVVVYRRCEEGIEYLLLHRAHSGPDYDGDWAWTPPSGARQPGESILECAERELREEIGVGLPLVATEFGSSEWYVYAAEMERNVKVELDEEHDKFDWVTIHAVSRCKPDFVAAAVFSVGEMLGA